jgi:hypothetical protein
MSRADKPKKPPDTGASKPALPVGSIAMPLIGTSKGLDDPRIGEEYIGGGF